MAPHLDLLATTRTANRVAATGRSAVSCQALPAQPLSSGVVHDDESIVDDAEIERTIASADAELKAAPAAPAYSTAGGTVHSPAVQSLLDGYGSALKEYR